MDMKRKLNELANRKELVVSLKEDFKDLKISGEYDDISKKDVDFRYNQLKGEIKKNPELRGKLIDKVVEKKIVDEVEHDINIDKINGFSELSDFLDIQSSMKTRKNYHRSVCDFIIWCAREKIDFMKITRKEAESYLVSLSHKYAPNSVRTKILSICSFYQFLLYRYSKIITFNSFSKLKLPRIVPSRRIDIVTDNDIRELKKELKRINRADILCAVDLLCKYGFRVGIFESMKIDGEGNWNSVSKKHVMKGKFLKSEVQKINESGLLKLKGSTITSTIVKYTRKLKEKGKVGSAFSPHDIRHYYITKYGKDLSIGDFVRFSRGIHKNVTTTLGYLNIK